MTDHKKVLNQILANVFETMINGQQVTACLKGGE